MTEDSTVAFGPFQLHGQRGPLIRDGEEIALSPKGLAVLWALVRRAGAVMTKTELFDAVWSGKQVEEVALNYQIHALREALGDDARHPKYIATQHRVGFRFVAELEQTLDVPNEKLKRPFVGRQNELRQLDTALACALAGQPQVLFISGDAGVGKTRLIEHFKGQLQIAHPDALLGYGHCAELFGAGEPYLPILDALNRLLRSTEGSGFIPVLERCAPNWLLQLPALLQKGQWESLQQRTSGAGRERLFRELSEALEQISQDQPLILILEDLHWADPSTIEIIKNLASPARQGQLLLLCSYRPVQTEMDEHSIKALKRELIGRGHASEIALGDMTASEVSHYLDQRLPGLRGDKASLSAQVFAQTGGQPLLLTHVCDVLAEKAGYKADVAACIKLAGQIPQRLRDLLEAELSQLDELDQRLLEAASLVGQNFAAACVAAALEHELDSIERRCQKLARQGLFIAAAELAVWPDGTVSGSYQFRHTLYAQALRERMSSVQRARLAGRIGERLEAAYRDRNMHIASELAEYFETAGMIEKALRYQMDTTRRVLASKALLEGRAKLAKCQQLLKLLPDSPARLHTEFNLAILRLNTDYIESGYTSSALQDDLNYLRNQIDHIDDAELESMALTLLWRYESFCSNYEVAAELSQRLVGLGRQSNKPFIECTGLARTALVHHLTGQPEAAESYSSKAVAIANANTTALWGDSNVDPGIAALICNATSQCLLGRPDTGLQVAQQCVDRAKTMHNPYMECAARGMSLTTVLLYRRDFAQLLASATQSIALSQQYGHRESLGWGMKMQGIAMAMTGKSEAGLAMLRQIIAAQRAAGSLLALTVDYAHEAEACLLDHRVDEAQVAVEQGFNIMQAHNERLWEPELWRIRGEVLLADHPAKIADATHCFETAWQLALDRSGLMMQLRAGLSLARIQGNKSQRQQALNTLAELLNQFQEGQQTADLIEARGLVAA